jgi:hypothetical protein
MIDVIVIDPRSKTKSRTPVDFKLHEALQAAIGNKSYETVVIPDRRGKATGMLIVDATAKLTGVKDRFFIHNPSNPSYPIVCYGKALLAAVSPSGKPVNNPAKREAIEIAFPTDERVTPLDHYPETIGWFVPSRAERDPRNANTNFMAILSDERFVAAMRVVLATYEDHLEEAVFGGVHIPTLECRFAPNILDDAMDLYDRLLTDFGYTE